MIPVVLLVTMIVIGFLTYLRFRPIIQKPPATSPNPTPSTAPISQKNNWPWIVLGVIILVALIVFGIYLNDQFKTKIAKPDVKTDDIKINELARQQAKAFSPEKKNPLLEKKITPIIIPVKSRGFGEATLSAGTYDVQTTGALIQLGPQEAPKKMRTITLLKQAKIYACFEGNQAGDIILIPQ